MDPVIVPACQRLLNATVREHAYPQQGISCFPDGGFPAADRDRHAQPMEQAGPAIKRQIILNKCTNPKPGSIAMIAAAQHAERQCGLPNSHKYQEAQNHNADLPAWFTDALHMHNGIFYFRTDFAAPAAHSRPSSRNPETSLMICAPTSLAACITCVWRVLRTPRASQKRDMTGRIRRFPHMRDRLCARTC